MARTRVVTHVTVVSLAAATWLALPPTTGAQAPNDQNTVRLGAFGIDPEYLPYGRPWFLTGPGRGTPLVIGWVSARADTTGPPTSVGCWRADTTATPQAEFTLPFEKLAHGERYWVTVWWLRTPPSDRVRAAVMAVLDSASGGNLTAPMLNQGVERSLGRDAGGGSLLAVSGDDLGRCQVEHGLEGVGLEQALIDEALDVFFLHQRVLSDIQDRAVEFGIADSSPPPPAVSLQALAEDATLTLDRALPRLERIRTQACPAGTATAPCDSLRTLIERGRAIEAPIATITDRYVQVARARTDGRAEFRPSGGSTIPLGSAVAYGVGMMSASGGDAEWPAVGMIQAKWYFGGAVDKSLPDPYFGRGLSRLSLGIGLLLGDKPSYQGHELEGLFGSVWPALTMNYDIGNGIFAVQAGTLLFRQPSLDPFATETTLRAAFHAGLSLDLDAFNSFSAILTRRPF